MAAGQRGRATSSARSRFDSDTGKHFRAKVQAAFFARYLKDKGEKPPEALMFQTGSNKWVEHDRWPPKAAVTAQALLPARMASWPLQRRRRTEGRV